MPRPAEFHQNEATAYADAADRELSAAAAEPDPRVATLNYAHAQVCATLATAHRTAEQTAVLADLFGDDSHLDGLKRAVRDGLEGIRADGIGVG